MTLHRIQELKATCGWFDVDTGHIFSTASQVLNTFEKADEDVTIEWRTCTKVGQLIVDVLQ